MLTYYPLLPSSVPAPLVAAQKGRSSILSRRFSRFISLARPLFSSRLLCGLGGGRYPHHLYATPPLEEPKSALPSLALFCNPNDWSALGFAWRSRIFNHDANSLNFNLQF